MTRIEELQTLILKHKALYYQGIPSISDEEYDNLEEELKRLDPDNFTLKLVGTSLKSEKKIKHATKMLSLDKTYSSDDLKKWIQERKVISTPKIDGMSGSLIYKNGQLTIAKTRGDGQFGEDILDKVSWMNSIPKMINDKRNLEIRGEIFCYEKAFNILKDKMTSMGLDAPTSQRNIVAGLISRKENIPLCQHLSFKAFELLGDEVDLTSESEKVDYLKKLGFDLPPFILHSTFETVSEEIQRIKIFMNEGDYLIDGIVFSYDNLELHKTLGETSHHPRYKMAFKFQGEVKTATIQEVKWNVSRNGILTPVAKINPTELSGAQITNVTLHNYGVVRDSNLKPGDQIEITRSGEVIPKFLSVIKSIDGKIELPDACPSCNRLVEVVDIRILCKNSQCPAQIKESILNFIQKISIDDLSSKRLEEMMRVGLVKTIPDLYRLTFDDLMKLDKTKEKMANKLLENISKTKSETDITTFLSSLGLNGGAYNKCEKIVKAGHDSIPKLKKMTLENLCSIDGFAEKSSKDLLTSLKDRFAIIDELTSLGLRPILPTETTSKLSGRTICITGTLSEKRSVIEDKLRQGGMKIVKSVSKNTDYLLTNDPNSSSSKCKKAIELGLSIISETELEKLLKG